MIKINKSLLCLSIILILLVNLSFASAITGSIGNARAVLYPKIGSSGTTIDRTILVQNVNNESVNVTLQADANFTIAKIIDSNFVLKPGESKNARFQLIIKKSGDYDGKIYVLFAPFSGYGAGVALSAELIVHASSGGSDSGNTDDNTNLGVNNGSKISSGLIIVSISTLVLLILLLLLIFLSKRNKVKKRRDRS